MNAIFQRRIGALVLWVLMAVLLALGQCRAWREGADLSARADATLPAGGQAPMTFRM